MNLQEEVTELLRKEFSKPNININLCSKKTLLQVLDALRIYHIQERALQAFDDDYADLMTAIASRLNRKVWP